MGDTYSNNVRCSIDGVNFINLAEAADALSAIHNIDKSIIFEQLVLCKKQKIEVLCGHNLKFRTTRISQPVLIDGVRFSSKRAASIYLSKLEGINSKSAQSGVNYAVKSKSKTYYGHTVELAPYESDDFEDSDNNKLQEACVEILRKTLGKYCSEKYRCESTAQNVTYCKAAELLSRNL